MDSAGLRNRDKPVVRYHDHSTVASTDNGTVTELDIKDPPVPRYTIDLSLLPVDRYKHVAKDFKFHAKEIPTLFDDVARECAPNISVDKIKKISRLALRKVQNTEENEELRGISEVIGVEMWYLVAHNVLLDMYMGCTSGGVRVNHNGPKSRVLHFRTLDWGMDPLRKIVVHLDFVERAGGEVIASSLTYFGFVGVLTGVRKGLSVSLNFRPTHNNDGYFSNMRFYTHMALVLLGIRPSVSSILRHMLLPNHTKPPNPRLHAQTLEDIERTLPGTATTAAYLILCNGDRIVTMEKDNHTATIRSSTEFNAATNHDVAQEEPGSTEGQEHSVSKIVETAGMKEVVEESVSRKCAIVEKWKQSQAMDSDLFASNAIPRQVLTRKDVVNWVNDYPITNESTHFATIMDPKAGKVVWLKRYLEPLE